MTRYLLAAAVVAAAGVFVWREYRRVIRGAQREIDDMRRSDRG